jgi:hypothetical protein
VAKKQAGSFTIVLLGMAIGLGIFFYFNQPGTDSVAVRIGTSLLATSVTVAVAFGILTLIRKLRAKS